MKERICETPRLRYQRRLAFYTLIAGAAVAGALFFLGDVIGLRVNFTSSEPIGLWRIVPLQRPLRVGDVVFICPPNTRMMREARSRGYLRPGLCHGDFAPMIKSVAALANQRVSVGIEVRVDGVRISPSNVVVEDAAGRKLTHYAGGVVPPGALFVYSSSPHSYDSRYFGVVSVQDILGVATNVFTAPWRAGKLQLPAVQGSGSEQLQR